MFNYVQMYYVFVCRPTVQNASWIDVAYLDLIMTNINVCVFNKTSFIIQNFNNGLPVSTHWWAPNTSIITECSQAQLNYI